MTRSAPDRGCRNLRWALALFDGLIAGGMRRLVLSPGARSTPLVLAGQRQPELELTPILDERSAAFFALGLARASGRPVGLLCTSGSALAHWFPAVIEASESGISLILLSADRPPELRGWGTNQTIDQTRLFGGFVREFHDPGPAEAGSSALKRIRALGARAAAVSLGNWPGPVHLNLPFREPLVPAAECVATPVPAIAPAVASSGTPHLASWRRRDTGSEVAIQELAPLLRSGRGLICCGPGAGFSAGAESLWACARQLGVPVLCDPLSSLRGGSGGTLRCGFVAAAPRIARYDSLLRDPAMATTLKPDWALRFGRAPVSKILLDWLSDIPTVLVDPGQGWSDPTQDVRQRIRAPAGAFCEWLAESELAAAGSGATAANSGWLEQWIAAERLLERRSADYLAQAPWCEAQLLVALCDAIPAGEGLFCANSLPIRQLDTWSGSRDAALRVFGNRGASGIDGQSSTLAGLNAAGIPTTGLMGDLSFLHDLSGLLLLRQLDRPCLVLNNGGGRIFDYLPQQTLPGCERFWRTPVALDLERLAQTFGIAHRAVEDDAGFRAALAETLGTGQHDEPPRERSGIIEVRLDAEVSRAVHQTFWRSLREEGLRG